MSNEENILNSHSIEGAPTPYVPYPPTFMRTNDSHQAMALNFMPATNYVLAPHGSPIWEGSAAELAALVRDARRFRKLMQAHWDMGGEQGWSDWYDDTYNRQIMPGTLAEIADALPEVEQK